MPRKIVAQIVVILCLHAAASAEMYKIKNPAEKINNPADKIYNPATQINNPAANVYNPATRMNEANPLSPPTQPVPKSTAPEVTTANKPTKLSKEQSRPDIPQKSYYFKTSKEYVAAAKKAFVQEDYLEFLSITEDALRRIQAGTLKASKKTKQQLAKYKEFGYGLLEKNEE
ncbi:hypothetical protein KI809_06120 [Geobacter pelophilus]|uniref:Uncharacterized protein n=1 Tax=Geoanaerobacter pelophilus TaxID=60036 RepID=A0AAW4KYP4_9BACT|nr:hypothetical protein [Geoanaerobacter pelophilus]MBT0663874.1 hypothetical protein [Geoanaerobacter pelophilus]